MIDIHAHIGRDPYGTEGRIQEILLLMKMYGIKKTVIFTIDEKDRGMSYRRQNDRVIRMVNKYPTRLIGFCRVQPKAGKAAVQEMWRCRERGLKGLKLHARSDFFEPHQALEVLKTAEEFQWPVLLHTDHQPFGQPEMWEKILKQFKKINFILAHGGKDDCMVAGRIARELSHVYLDTTTLSYNRTGRLLKVAGFKKLIYGSDYPYSHPLIEKQKYELLLSDVKRRRRVFFENALQILNL